MSCDIMNKEAPMTTTTTTETITDEQIRALRTEAGEHGDHAQVLICDIALGEVVLDEGTPIESLRIASFIDVGDRLRIAERFGDEESARAECATVMAEAEGQS